MKTLTNIITEYLYSSKVSIDYENFTLHLYSNPDFPTIKSISDTFDYFHIANIVAKVPKDSLHQLPVSFLAVIRRKDQDEVVMVTRKKNKVTIKGQSSKKSISLDSFLDLWQGTIIAVEKGKDRKMTMASGQSIPIVTLIVLIFAIQWSLSDSMTGLLSLSMLIGTIISVLIIREEMGFGDRLANRICQGLNHNGGCARVITSRDSKLFGLVSLSSASATYFIAMFLSLNLLGSNAAFLFITSAVGLPLIFFSWYSQAFRLRQWCLLCLGVSLLLIINLIVSGYIFYSTNLSLNVLYFIQASLLFLIVYVAVNFLKGYILQNKNLKREQLDLYKFKKDIGIFNAILNASNTADKAIIPDSLKISFGAETPAVEIDAFTNPTCGFCNTAFKVYYELLQSYGDSIRINLMFNVPIDNDQNIATKIAAKAINLYTDGKKIEALEMLNSWYSTRKSEQWLKRYEESGTIPMKTNHILETHKNWGSSNGINYTPATLINGRIFPDKYKIEDLLLLASDLITQKKKTLVMEDA